MKILMLFIDALRVDKFYLYNSSQKYNCFDKFIENIGGELFTNCFTSSPDTYRSLASLFIGKNSDITECNNYSKPLYPFGEKYYTLWDEVLKNNYNINIFHSPFEKFIFPKKIQKYLPDNLNINTFVENLNLNKNHIVWIGLDDFRHYSYYSKYSHNKVDNNINNLCKVFNILNKEFINKFDEVFIFSDHGVLFDKEFLKIDSQKFQIIDERRTQVFFLHKSLENNKLNYNNSLCYLSDMNQVIMNVINNLSNYNYKDREYLILEDMDFSSMELSSMPSIFSLVTKNDIYIRSFKQKIANGSSMPDVDRVFFINRITNERKIIESIKEKDKILLENSNFRNLYKIYNFWMKETQEIKKLKEKYNLQKNKDFDSFGNIISYNKYDFSLFSFISFIKSLLPPILFYFIKKLLGRV